MKNHKRFQIFIGISVLGAIFCCFVVTIFSMHTSEMGKVDVAGNMEQIQKQQQLIAAELSKKRGLLILLDEKEKDKLAAMGGALETALYQEAGPIIVSTSLLCTLFEQRTKDQRSNTVLVDEVMQDKNSQKNDDNDDIVCSRVSFQLERWVIKKINESLILLIPKSYLELLHINADQVLKFGEGKQRPLDIELELGLKVSHMETINNIELIKRPSAMINSDYLIKSLDDIFCKKYDYKNRNISIPEWCIYMGGHGRPRYDKDYFYQYRIVGLSLDGFQKTLAFFENKIGMQLLVVMSCFASGVNSIETFGEIKSGTQNYYSFPIIIQALNDMITTSLNPSVDYKAWSTNKILQLITYRDFASFLKKAASLEGDYREIIRPISDEVTENIAQIKLPGIEWFSIKEIDKKIVSIGSILTATRNPQKPLNISTYFKKDPDVILLYTDDIPFELVISSSKVEAIVSMVSSGYLPDKPGLVIHTIKGIRGLSFESLMKRFQLVASSSVLEYGSKWFFIEKIKGRGELGSDKNNILIFGRDTDTVRVYYEEYGAVEKGELKGEKYIGYGRCKDEEEIKDYKDRLEIVKTYSLKRGIANKDKMENIKKIEGTLSLKRKSF